MKEGRGLQRTHPFIASVGSLSVITMIGTRRSTVRRGVRCFRLTLVTFRRSYFTMLAFKGKQVYCISGHFFKGFRQEILLVYLWNIKSLQVLWSTVAAVLKFVKLEPIHEIYNH